MKKNVYFLSTLETNIGDEFIRDGLLAVLYSILPNESWEWKVFNKHNPCSFYPSYHPVQLVTGVNKLFHRRWQRGLDRLSALPGNRFFNADIVIQSGTPILWEQAYRSRWARPFWQNFAGKNNRRIPLLNIGGGSCFPWSAPPDQLEGPAKDFAKRMVQTSSILTVRDPLAARLLSEASGKNIPVIPCPGFLAGQYHSQTREPDGRILFNVMPLGGHFDFLNQMNPATWKETINCTIKTLPEDYRVEFICHSQDEKAFAEKHWPAYPVHFPKTPEAYFSLCTGASAAVVNRLHAAVGLSGLSIPCIAIGTDTRMLMTKEIGIPTFFAPTVSLDILRNELRALLENQVQVRNQLSKKREKVLLQYRKILSPFFSEGKGSDNPPPRL